MRDDQRADLGRVPPHDELAEQAILGAFMMDEGQRLVPLIRSIAGPETFYVEANRAIYEAAIELNDAGTRIDAVTLSARLAARGQLDRVGNAVYLNALIDAVPVLSCIEDQAAIVRDHALRRRAILSASQVMAAAFDPGSDLSMLSSELGRAASDVLPRQATRSPAEIMHDHLTAVPGREVRFSLPYTDSSGMRIDWGEQLGAMAPGQKMIVGGRTSEGKTALLRSFWLACGVAGVPASYVSFEDSDDEIVAGAAGGVSWLSTRPILSHYWNDRSRTEGERIERWFARLPLFCAYFSTPTVEEMSRTIRWQVAHNGVRVVVVDYLQKVRGGDGREGRVAYLGRALAEMSRSVRGEAVLIVGSQLRRAPAGAAKDRAPGKDDLRDSGEIEEDAKVVVLLRRAGEDSMDERGIPMRRGIVLDVAKNKLGPTGEVPATLWLRHTSLWPGVVRPTFNLDGGPVMMVGTNVEDQPPNEGEPPPWVQQELPAGEEYTHAGGEEAPF